MADSVRNSPTVPWKKAAELFSRAFPLVFSAIVLSAAGFPGLLWILNFKLHWALFLALLVALLVTGTFWTAGILKLIAMRAKFPARKTVSAFFWASCKKYFMPVVLFNIALGLLSLAVILLFSAAHLKGLAGAVFPNVLEGAIGGLLFFFVLPLIIVTKDRNAIWRFFEEGFIVKMLFLRLKAIFRDEVLLLLMLALIFLYGFSILLARISLPAAIGMETVASGVCLFLYCGGLVACEQGSTSGDAPVDGKMPAMTSESEYHDTGDVSEKK